MKVLATAKPNKSYVHYNNLRDIIIQAVLNDNHIHYYEISPGKMVALMEEVVWELFPTECIISDRPFLVKENMDFWIVLNRHHAKFKDQFKKLVDRRVMKIRRTT